MPNLHPPLTAFPLALLLVVAILEIVLLFRPRYRDHLQQALAVNLFFAMVAVIAAFFSGYQASDAANQTFRIADDVISTHHSWGRLLLFAVIPCWALELLGRRARYYRPLFRVGYFLLLAICVALVVVTGYLGGQLVFEHGAGVSAKF